jgi:hypothetical protein
MKHSPRLQRIVDRMKPGVLSLEGFLGPDARPIKDILDADASAVASLDATHEEFAATLQRLLEEARVRLERDVPLGGGLVARYDERMGRIACPFGECGTFQKGEVVLTFADGRILRFSPLGVHLIARHGFYGGRGSRYRMEPREIAELSE